MVPGAADGILRTLSAFGFEWDGAVLRQSARTDRYRAALDRLQTLGLTFECSCTRSQLADEDRYPGHCRERPRIAGVPTAVRLRVAPGAIRFTDRIQGMFRQDVAAAVGDPALQRRDGLFTYVLAVVVDDAEQHVTHVVRGADLLDNTPRQIYLQERLDLATPVYAHVPVLTEGDGRKLAKSARSIRMDDRHRQPQLLQALTLLGLSPPAELLQSGVRDIWAWAIGRWDAARVPRRLVLPLTT